jgi:hypothetical protein
LSALGRLPWASRSEFRSTFSLRADNPSSFEDRDDGVRFDGGVTSLALRFEWDRTKAAVNARKHGVRFDEALTVFGDPLSLTIADVDKGAAEHRFAIVGLSFRRRLLVVFHAERDETIRIISARLATRREKRVYEEGED